MIVNLNLPYPPSANRLWRYGQGRAYKSAEYTNWLIAAGLQVRAQRPEQVKGHYTLHIWAVRPDNRRRDIGNLEKPISDLLQSVGVIENDCLAKKIVMEWDEDPGAEEISVSIVGCQ